jgi:hypothetical protein
MELPSFAFAAKRDPLDRHALNAVACGISSRKYARSLDPLPEVFEDRSTSKISVSRRYVAMTTKQMTSWLTTPVGDRDVLEKREALAGRGRRMVVRGVRAAIVEA